MICNCLLVYTNPEVCKNCPNNKHRDYNYEYYRELDYSYKEDFKIEEKEKEDNKE